MCKIAESIEIVRAIQIQMSRIPSLPEEIEELTLHLAIEAEKYLRRHEAKCKECQKEEVRA